MKIRLTKHAQEKLSAFQGGNVYITEADIIHTITTPDFVDIKSRPNQFIAQKELDTRHVLRVVYTLEATKTIKVITFYPGRKIKYEK